MKNLLKETIKVLDDHNKISSDVLWCGSKEFGYFTWEDYVNLADIEYDSGYGVQEIATDLLIVGKDWHLERHEYDGSEWWEYKETPTKPQTYNLPKMLKGDDSYATLTEINRPGGKYQED